MLLSALGLIHTLFLLLVFQVRVRRALLGIPQPMPPTAPDFDSLAANSLLYVSDQGGGTTKSRWLAYLDDTDVCPELQVCVCAGVFVCLCVCVGLLVCVCLCARMVCVCVCVRARVCASMCLYVCTRARVRACIYVRVHV